MKVAFCTIITKSHIPFSKTLFQSLNKYDSEIESFSLIVDSEISFNIEEFQVIRLQELFCVLHAEEISKKYFHDIDALRWSLKSVLMIFLLQSKKFDQVYFVDPDLYFYSDFHFLYQELNNHSFLLSPHWGCMHPEKSEVYFQRLMTDGLYNAGFLGATSKGLSTLYHWAELCLHACERDKNRGLFVDQAYLNFFPILNPDSKIVYHRGCNVAEWNRFEISRSLDENGDLILDGIYPLVFIHFSNLGYLVEHDPLLIPYLERYEEELRKNGFVGSLIAPARSFVHRQRLKQLNFLERIVRKVLGQESFAKFKGWEN
jgi:hypothetical protein